MENVIAQRESRLTNISTGPTTITTTLLITNTIYIKRGYRMKFEIMRDKLRDGLSDVIKAISQKVAIQILTGIKIEVD